MIWLLLLSCSAEPDSDSWDWGDSDTDTDTQQDGDPDVGSDTDTDSGTDPGNNVAPVASGIEGTPVTWAGDAVQVSSTLTLSDADDTDLAGATVSITAGYQEGYDSLVITARPAEVEGAWDGTNGVLTITGAVSLSSYETLLRSIRYDNTGEVGLNSVTRTVTYVVDDGFATSTPVARDVQISAR